MRHLILSAVVSCLALSGCAVVEFLTPEKPPHYQALWEVYSFTKLRESTAADVLPVIRASKYELLSQSKSVVASSGQKRRTLHTWFNMVAFDENKLTAKRKYLLVINEVPKILFTEPWARLSFDCEMVLDADVLGKPYANENAMRIAILKQMLENARKDLDEVGPDNNTLNTSGMAINQAIEILLVDLQESPARAARLDEPSGLAFHHINLDKGKIQMLTQGDVATVKMMLGSFVPYFEKQRPLPGQAVGMRSR